jgi:hypothetical protein
MSTKNKLIIAAALLAVGSPVLGAATLIGSSLASAQDRLQVANQSDAAYRANGTPDKVTLEVQKWGLLGF